MWVGSKVVVRKHIEMLVGRIPNIYEFILYRFEFKIKAQNTAPDFYHEINMFQCPGLAAHVKVCVDIRKFYISARVSSRIKQLSFGSNFLMIHKLFIVVKK